MRSVVVLVSAILTLLAVPARTQQIPRKDAEDRVFGWMKIYDFKAATAPMTVDHRVYSVAQLSVMNNFANWIQQSYVPVGGLEAQPCAARRHLRARAGKRVHRAAVRAGCGPGPIVG